MTQKSMQRDLSRGDLDGDERIVMNVLRLICSFGGIPWG
jgi:hypothetical protein